MQRVDTKIKAGELTQLRLVNDGLFVRNNLGAMFVVVRMPSGKLIGVPVAAANALNSKSIVRVLEQEEVKFESE